MNDIKTKNSIKKIHESIGLFLPYFNKIQVINNPNLSPQTKSKREKIKIEVNLKNKFYNNDENIDNEIIFQIGQIIYEKHFINDKIKMPTEGRSSRAKSGKQVVNFGDGFLDLITDPLNTNTIMRNRYIMELLIDKFISM